MTRASASRLNKRRSVQFIVPEKRFSPMMECIYCGAKENLTLEHTIPLSLWGKYTIPEASCNDCAKETARFEGVVSRSMLGNFRMKLGFPTRRKKDRPAFVSTVMRSRDGTPVGVSIKLTDYPTYVAMPVLPGPRLISLTPPDDVRMQLIGFKEELDRTVQKYGMLEGPSDDTLRAFYRLLAKIAHCHTVVEIREGRIPELKDNLRFLLQDFIIKGEGDPFQFVGCFKHGVPAPTNLIHRVEPCGIFKILKVDFSGNRPITTEGNPKYITCIVRLLEFFGAPEYAVVVAKVENK